MDRVLVGNGITSSQGSGLFASRLGANVLDPDQALTGNLSFDSSDFTDGSLEVIQSGQFTLTCKREVIPANFPSGINYMETAGVEIEIEPANRDGTIPEIAIWYAVGNSSGYFHPWYTDVAVDQDSLGSNGYGHDNATFTDRTKIKHMDSAQFRGKFKNQAQVGYVDPSIEVVSDMNRWPWTYLGITGITEYRGWDDFYLEPSDGTFAKNVVDWVCETTGSVHEGTTDSTVFGDTLAGYETSPLTPSYSVFNHPNRSGYTHINEGLYQGEDIKRSPIEKERAGGTRYATLADFRGGGGANVSALWSPIMQARFGIAAEDVVYRANSLVFNTPSRINANDYPHSIFSQNSGLVGVVYFADNTRLIVNAFMTPTYTSMDGPSHETATYEETQADFTTLYATVAQGGFGGNSYLTIPHHTSFNLSNSDFSIEFWMYPTTSVASQTVIHTVSGTAADTQFNVISQ